MKNKKNALCSLLIMLTAMLGFYLNAQQKNGAKDAVESKNISTSKGPNGIVRTIKQDKKGNIWITSWEGVFKYDGKSFTNVTSKVSSARFFSVLENSKGNLWFASIGSGVYFYDGKSFQNFTTKNGLANDRVAAIYEDKNGMIWFGTEKGASRYDGKSFQNFKMSEPLPVTITDSVYVGADSALAKNQSEKTSSDSVPVSFSQNMLPKMHWTHDDVNAIIQDKTGKFWFATRGYVSVYDGKTFTTVINKNGKPFTNVRSLIKDKKGTIWLGGADGLWRYDGSTFTNFTTDFVGYIYEDRKGNLWTSSESAQNKIWELSKYDQKTLSHKNPTVTKIANKPMIFGILEDTKGNIWFGAFDGVYRFDGKTITDFK